MMQQSASVSLPVGALVRLGEATDLDSTSGQLVPQAMWGLAFTQAGALRGATHPNFGSIRTAKMGLKPLQGFGPPSPRPDTVGKLLASYDHPPARPDGLRLEFLQDAEVLRMWIRDCSPRAWNRNGEMVESGVHRSLRFLTLPVLSPDGQFLTCLGARSDEIIQNQRLGRRRRLWDRGEIHSVNQPTKIPLALTETSDRPPLRGRVQLFSSSTGEVLWECFPFGRRHLTSLAFSKDAAWLACGSRAGELSLLGLLGGGGRIDLTGATGSIQALAFSPDHRFLVAACRLGRRTRKGNRLLVFDLRTYRCLGDLGRTADHCDVLRLEFAPGGNTLLVVEHAPAPCTGSPGRASLYRLAWRDSPEEGPAVRTEGVAPLSGHAGGILSATLSPDGARLATAGVAGSVLVWDVEETLRSG